MSLSARRLAIVALVSLMASMIGGANALAASPHSQAGLKLTDLVLRDSLAAPEVPSEVETTAPFNIRPMSVDMNGLLNTGGAETKYYFEYGTAKCTPTCPGKSEEGSLSAGEGQQPVSVYVADLSGSTTYYYRLVATNVDGTTTATTEQSFTTTPALAPTITGTTVERITAGDATVNAQIDPNELVSTYLVEYGTTAGYGLATTEVSAGASGEPIALQVTLTGLTPSSPYHFRIVATNAAGTERTADGTFTTGASSASGTRALPGGRTDVMVSPLENHDAEADVAFLSGNLEEGIQQKDGVFQIAEDGNAVAYMSQPTIGGGGNEAEYFGGDEQVATKNANGGWTQTTAEPEGRLGSAFQGDELEVQAFSPDLSFDVFATNCDTCNLPGPLPKEEIGLDERVSPSGEYKALIPVVPPYRITGPFEPEQFGAWEVSRSFETVNTPPVFAGASADGSETLFEANDTLTSGAPGGNGEDPQTHHQYAEENNLYVNSSGQLSLVNVLPDGTGEANASFGAPPFEGPRQNPPDFSHVISSDGSRVFWTDLNTNDLYVRENPDQPQSPVTGGECTVASDACTKLIAEDARFWTATPSGSKVLYSTAAGLYEYDLEAAQSVELSEGASVEGVLGTSEDGSYVYYAAEGAKLYGWHEGQKAQPIAMLSGEDGTEERPYNGAYNVPGRFGDWIPGLGHRTAEATPNGQALVFTSTQKLTDYNNEGYVEVYVYETQAGPGSAQLFCASCYPSGERPPEPTEEEKFGGTAGFLPVSAKDTFLPHWISEDGSEVYFESTQPLLPQDTNGRVDVYEWQRGGTHGCEQEAGCIALLSGGYSPTDSWLIGASRSGKDLFLETRADLVPEDTTDYYDVFDACTGCERPVSPICSGTGCQGLPASPPTFATPASETFEGVGNFPPTETDSSTEAKTKPKTLTRAQKLAQALNACQKDRGKHKRAVCKARARKEFASAASKTTKPAKVRK